MFKKFLPQTLKFLVVRHPFERVMSAYVDKLESQTRDVQYRGGYYYAMYGHDIVAAHRHKYKHRYSTVHSTAQYKVQARQKYSTILLNAGSPTTPCSTDRSPPSWSLWST